MINPEVNKNLLTGCLHALPPAQYPAPYKPTMKVAFGGLFVLVGPVVQEVPHQLLKRIFFGSGPESLSLSKLENE